VTESSCWSYRSPWTAAQSEAYSTIHPPSKNNCLAEKP
jgi:hypothetical protein